MVHPLLDAINRGDVAQVLELMAEDRPVDINEAFLWNASQTVSPFFKNPVSRPSPIIESEEYQCTAINLAVLSGNKSIVRILLQCGADPNREDSRKRNALVCALYGIDTLKMASDTFSFLSCSLPEYLELIRILIPHMVISSLNKPLESLRGTSVLCFACYLGKSDAVKFLLSCEHIAINSVDCKGATALMYAVREGHQVIVRELVKKNARPELTNQEGFSAIQYARNAPIITYELEKALSLIRIQNTDLGQFSTPITSFKNELSKVLAEDHVLFLSDPSGRELPKADPTINEVHQTLLNHVQKGQVDKVQQMVIAYFKPPLMPQRASLINFHDKVTGLTPAHKAVCNGNDSVLAMIETLYLAGVDLNSASWSGRTPLHHLCILAVQEKCPTGSVLALDDSAPHIFSLLASRMIDLGASVSVVDKKGKTPLHYAAKCDETLISLINLLLEKGADPKICDHSKKTPAECADSPAVASVITSFINKSAEEQEPLESEPSERSRSPSYTSNSQVLSNKTSISQDQSEISVPFIPTLNDHVQKFLDRYRLFDSEVSLEWMPVLRDIKALVHSRVIAGSSRHQFKIEGSQQIQKFKNLVLNGVSHMDRSFQLYTDLFQKRELILDELHSRYNSLAHNKESLLSLWRQEGDVLPHFKQDLRSLISRLGSFNSECSFLISSFSNKRSAFLQEFQRQMTAQQFSVKENIRDFTDLVEAEEDSIHYESELENNDIPPSPTSRSESTCFSPTKNLDIEHLEKKLQSLSLNSKNIQADMNEIKTKLSELRDQKNILVSEFSAQFSTTDGKVFERKSSRSNILIPLSDLAFQAEMLTSQHERLLAILEKRIGENEKQKSKIRKIRRELYKLSPSTQHQYLEQELNSDRPSLERSNSNSSVNQSLSIIFDSPPASQKLIDLMLQIQAMDLALFSLNTWIPYRAGGLKSVTSNLDNSIERLSSKVEEFRSNMICIEQHTSQLRQTIQQKESHLNQTVSSRENWLLRVKQSIEEAQNLTEDQYSSHSLKHWPWDFETAFRQCQVTNLEESCLILASDLDSHQGHLQATHSKVTSFISQLKFQDQYLKTKLHSNDIKKPGAFHEIQYLENFLEKIKQRDLVVQCLGRPRSWNQSNNLRPTSIFGTPELVPSSPTSSSSMSFDSNNEIISNHRYLSNDDSKPTRQPIISVYSDLGSQTESSIRTHRSKLSSSVDPISTYSKTGRQSSIDSTYPGRKSSLFKPFINKELSSSLSHVTTNSRIRRASSSYGLHLANNSSTRPASHYTGSSNGSATNNGLAQRRTLRSCGSMAALSTSTLSAIRTSNPSNISRGYSSPRYSTLSVPSNDSTSSRFNSLPSRTRALAKTSQTLSIPIPTRTARSNSNSCDSRPNLRRIFSELHPKMSANDSNSSRLDSPDSNSSDKGAYDRLGGLLTDARREVELLERLTSSSSGTSDLDRRQRALLVKKRVQVRQLSLALQKLGHPIVSPHNDSSPPPHRHSTLAT